MSGQNSPWRRSAPYLAVYDRLLGTFLEHGLADAGPVLQPQFPNNLDFASVLPILGYLPLQPDGRAACRPNDLWTLQHTSPNASRA